MSLMSGNMSVICHRIVYPLTQETYSLQGFTPAPLYAHLGLGTILEDLTPGTFQDQSISKSG